VNLISPPFSGTSHWQRTLNPVNAAIDCKLAMPCQLYATHNHLISATFSLRRRHRGHIAPFIRLVFGIVPEIPMPNRMASCQESLKLHRPTMRTGLAQALSRNTLGKNTESCRPPSMPDTAQDSCPRGALVGTRVLGDHPKTGQQARRRRVT
jgi:hypothetical protein